jgi:hypothetical protein
VRPITAQPGHTVEEVEAALASRNFVYADCFTITPLIGGSPLYYTNARRDITVVPIGGSIRQTYKSRAVLIEGLRSHNKIGVQVDEQQVKLDYTSALDFQARLSWPEALKLGFLDGATIRRDRFVATEWAPDLTYPWLGGMPWNNGVLTSLSDVGRQTATLNVKSALNVLDRQMPKQLYVSRCNNVWGDAACGVDRNDFATVVTISAGTPTTSFLPWTGASSNYVEGMVHIANSDSVTRVRKIQGADGTGLRIAPPLDFVPSVGAAFTAYEGCPGTIARCQDFHGGAYLDFYAGYDLIPVAESAV